MAQNSILLDKSLLFAARIVKLNKYLTKEKKKPLLQSRSSAVPQASEPMQTKQFTVRVRQILSQSSRFLSRKQLKRNIGSDF